MVRTLKAAMGVTILATGLTAGVAQAAFINGSISLSDGGLTVPGVPSTSIVSGLTTITQGTPTANSCSGAFTTGGGGACDQSPPLTASTFTTGGPWGGTVYTYGAFTFTLLNVSDLAPHALSCNAAGLCSDLLTLTLTGTVSGGGFQNTAFSGAWSGNGACSGTAGPPATCTSNVTASWSVSLVALGTPTVPEPGSLALIGIALAGLGATRFRKQR